MKKAQCMQFLKLYKFSPHPTHQSRDPLMQPIMHIQRTINRETLIDGGSQKNKSCHNDLKFYTRDRNLCEWVQWVVKITHYSLPVIFYSSLFTHYSLFFSRQLLPFYSLIVTWHSSEEGKIGVVWKNCYSFLNKYLFLVT